MKESSRIKDFKIQATNIMYEIRISDYVSVARNILKANSLQRNRVESSKTIYSLLKEDLQKGCVLPPIVLATTSDIPNGNESNLNQIEGLIILDGLQRTYTIIELYSQLEKDPDREPFNKFVENKIRIEIYFGINKFGILYRMLTLNSGQTPMSIRHQIEILYSDRKKSSSSGLEFITEKDDETPRQDHQYNLKVVVDGFQSYIDRNELPLQREDLLENIKSLEKLSKENQDQDQDLFDLFITCYHELMTKIGLITNQSEELLNEIKNPYGKNINSIFKKSQTITGFGAAVGKLIDRELIVDLRVLKSILPQLTNSNKDNYIYELLRKLKQITDTAKKIGNAQRLFFLHYFRVLLNPESDTYLDVYTSIDEGYKKYINDLM